MLFSDYLNNSYNGKILPDYYDTMYLDGYSMDEVWVAFHRTIQKKYMAQNEAETQANEIKISSEIKIK